MKLKLEWLQLSTKNYMKIKFIIKPVKGQIRT